MGKIITSADTNERKAIKTLKKQHGPAYRAWFIDNLVNNGWKVVGRNGFRLLKSPSGRTIDPFQGYRRPINYALLKIRKPGFYFVLDWSPVLTSAQLMALKEVIEKFSGQDKEIHLFRLRNLDAWMTLVGKKGTTAINNVGKRSIDKKYFAGIYGADEDHEFFIEVDIDIHSHPDNLGTSDDLDVSLLDRNYAKGMASEKRFFTVTYKNGFAPFTSRGRVHDSRGKKIVIPWDRISAELT